MRVIVTRRAPQVQGGRRVVLGGVTPLTFLTD
ncbi:hypothetical protein F783_003065 [Bordetella holmesii F627]|nr:hypothetical protein F783_003065 [Bordetella holmesii F627]SUV94277.1 Uncharacterised protein [Bordetella holmesii]